MGTLVPDHQGTVTLGPGPREFFYFTFLFLEGDLFLEKKISLLVLSISLSLYTQFGFF